VSPVARILDLQSLKETAHCLIAGSSLQAEQGGVARCLLAATAAGPGSRVQHLQGRGRSTDLAVVRIGIQTTLVRR
jgi:hypothetical protein